ncbi:hypothetical protein, partial [Cedecea sp. P7760]|uniref:hypothetical protein n=1 Tax=Cedecea sp. P7760 TaxID=2726983 RepID=UPI001C43228A
MIVIISPINWRDDTPDGILTASGLGALRLSLIHIFLSNSPGDIFRSAVIPFPCTFVSPARSEHGEPAAMIAGNKYSLTPALSQRERGKTDDGVHYLFPLPSRERVRVRVKIRSEARVRPSGTRLSGRFISPVVR